MQLNALLPKKLPAYHEGLAPRSFPYQIHIKSPATLFTSKVKIGVHWETFGITEILN